MAPAAHAAQGDLDPTFGQGGRVVTDIAVPGYPGFFPITESILVQPDGKVLVCGRLWHDGISYWYGTFLVRYLPDGTLDPSFGEHGKVAVIDPGFPYDTWTVGADMALQADGKIVLIGQYTVAAGIIVQRYTSSGMLDTTFGDNGRAVVPRPTEDRAMEGASIALQPNGKIVGVGWEFELTQPYHDAIVVFRLNKDGSMDAAFGPDGTGVATIIDGYGGGEVLVQPNGKILVAGILLNFSTGIRPTPLLARYNNDGSLDSSFGNSGVVTDRIDGLDSAFSSAAVQPDGKIIAIGRTESTSPTRSFVARYNRDGSPDTGFGANGVFSVESSFFRFPESVVLTPDRKIVALGHARDVASGGDGFAIIRLTSDGALDPSFGIGGRSLPPILDDGATQHAYVSDLAIRHDGRVLAAGYWSGDDSITVIRVDAGPRFSRPRPNHPQVPGGGLFSPSTGGGVEVEPNAPHRPTMTGPIVTDDSTFIDIPTYPNDTTDSPSIRFNTQGTRVAPWRIFNHDGGNGFHDHALTFAHNLTYDNTDGWVQDLTTATPLISSAPSLRWAFESSFTIDDPNNVKGHHEFNLDIDPNWGSPFKGIRPFGFYYDMDARKTTFSLGVFDADPNSGHYIFGTRADLFVNTDTLNVGDRSRYTIVDPNNPITNDPNQPGRIVFDPGFRASLADKAVLIRNQFPDGHLHIMSGLDPNTANPGKIFIGGGRRSDVIFGPWKSFQVAKVLVEGTDDIVQLRVRGNSSQAGPIFLVTNSSDTFLAAISNIGVETLLGGTEYTDDDTDITCGAGNYNISADTSEAQLKVCNNGVRGDIPSSLSGSGTLNFSDPAASSCSTDLTITVTGAAEGDVVSLGVPAGSVVAGGLFTAWVTTGGGSVTVRHCCVTAADCDDPASGTFKARVDNP